MRFLPPTIQVDASFERLLERVGRRVDHVPEGLMSASGWTIDRRVQFDGADGAGIARVRKSIDAAILKAWPAMVRLTCNGETLTILVWRHPETLVDASATAPFPKRIDVEHALRTLRAVGFARANFAHDQLSRLTSGDAGNDTVARVQRAVDEDQLCFEHVARALAEFAVLSES